MPNSEIADKDFARRFLELPWHIAGEICDLLPPHIITRVLLKVEKLRPLIIERYFSQDIRLYLPDERFPPDYQRIPNVETIVDIVGLDKIESFFRENPDIVPRKYTILPDVDQGSAVADDLDTLLQLFRDILSRASDLEIDFEVPEEFKYKILPSDEAIDYYLSYPNLSSLRTWFFPRYSDFRKGKKLKKLELLSYDDMVSWSNVSLPSSLTQLDISLVDEDMLYDHSSTMPYHTLNSMLWDKTFESGRLVRCPSLTTLRLTNCGLTAINVALFPPTLKSLFLGENNISKLVITGRTDRWPKGLTHLDLDYNEIGDLMLKRLSDLKWPPILEELHLGNNQFTSLDSLQNLPSSLKVLRLRLNKRLRSLEVSHGRDGYPYLVFPDSLVDLDLGRCPNLSWNTSGIKGAIPPLRKLRFPPNLESLGLEDCNLETLAHLEFPSTLRCLNLRANQLSSLTLCGDRSSGTELVSWERFKNLRQLYLSQNLLTTIKGWIPPRLLRSLGLSSNKLKCLNGKDTPLLNAEFDEVTQNIQSLDLSDNGLESLGQDVCFPRSLRSLYLSLNRFRKFEFRDSLASHESLVEVYLGHNPLRRISVESTKEKYASNLKKLDFSMREEDEKWEMSAAEMNRMFEQLGLRATQRTRKLLKKHEFY